MSLTIIDSMAPNCNASHEHHKRQHVHLRHRIVRSSVRPSQKLTCSSERPAVLAWVPHRRTDCPGCDDCCWVGPSSGSGYDRQSAGLRIARSESGRAGVPLFSCRDNIGWGGPDLQQKSYSVEHSVRNVRIRLRVVRHRCTQLVADPLCMYGLVCIAELCPLNYSSLLEMLT